MTHRNNVVQKTEPLTEGDFKAVWLCTLSRMCRVHGDAKVAMWLGISDRHLVNVKAGSLPSADKIWNLMAHDASAHDELDGEYGFKKVPRDAVCSTDPLTLDMIELAAETAADEAIDSPGGRIVTDHELLKKNEARLRLVRGKIDHWLHRIETLRKPSLRVA